MFVTLKAVKGPYAGNSRTVRLQTPDYKCSLGRNVPEEDIRLNKDQEVSGLHATFIWNFEKDCLQIRDENSFNGTALDFKRLEKGRLYDVKEGSTLITGKSKFIISISDAPSERKQEPENEMQDAQKLDESENSVVENCYCPICFKDLGRMTVTGRTQHVNSCIPENTAHNAAALPVDAVLTKAKNVCKPQVYESMTVPQLALLKQKIEDVKTKLEIELQKVQAAYYKKRSAEMLRQSPSVNSTPVLNRQTIASVKVDPSKELDLVFTQNPSVTKQLSTESVSDAQNRLTGANFPHSSFSTPQKRQQQEFVISDDSDDSLTTEITPLKKPRASIVTSPTRGVMMVSPRRTSILVSPTKLTQPKRLSAQDRGRLHDFYLNQLSSTPLISQKSEISQKINTLLLQSIDGLKSSHESYQEQLKTADSSQLPMLHFLDNVVNDAIAELELSSSREAIRNSISAADLRSPVKPSPRLSIRGFGSPMKGGKHAAVAVSEEDISNVFAAFAKDKNMQYMIDAKQILSLERAVSCVKRSQPQISAETVQGVLDRKSIKYYS